MEGEIKEQQSLKLTLEDVEILYGLTLGRTADAAAITEFAGHDLAFLLSVFFEGPEFRDRVLIPLAEQRLPDTGFYAWDVPEAVRRWAQANLPLTPKAAQRLGSLDYWPSFYLELFKDPEFQKATSLGPARPFGTEAWLGLNYLVDNAALFRRQAMIETVGSDWVEGWALDREATDHALRLELWLDGRFVSAGIADLFRRDLQDRFGGNGRLGYRLAAGDRLRAGARSVEIRDAQTGRRLTVAEHSAPPQSAELFEALMAELRGVRETLDRLHDALPQAVTRLSYPVEDYGRYAQVYGHTTGVGTPLVASSLGVGIRLFASNAEAFEVEEAVKAVLAQTYKKWSLEVLGLDDHGKRQLQSFLTRMRWTGRLIDNIQIGDATADGSASSDIWLTLPARGILAPEALAVFVSAFTDSEVAAAYSDGDVIDAGDVLSASRLKPQLRPAFDLDLLCQAPYVGRCVAFRGRENVPESLEQDAVAATILRLGVSGKSIVHVPAILFSEREQAATDVLVWADQVGKALQGGPPVSVEANLDLFGADVLGSVRVKRRSTSNAVSVIVPTRNALDLLKPCIDSVLAASAHNRTQLDLIIIDHESDDAETQAYLANLGEQGKARILPYKGAFNWALMNNLAVEIARGEILVFLNNDTVVISQDWQDELASQAERPDVACVGARLLYDDGTIQHAGFVAREREANFLIHDGVGAASDDPGYMGRHALLHQTVAVTGACLAIEASKFRALGGFDASHFPIEGNDVDLCMRAQSQGLKVLYDPHVALYHLESKTRGFSRDGEKLKVAEASGRLLWRRWGEQFGADPFYNARFDREARPFTRLRPLS